MYGAKGLALPVGPGATAAGAGAVFLGLARNIYIRCIYGIFGTEITKYTVIYGAYIQFRPTLGILNKLLP
jgi:hypothetical protein